MSVNPYLAPQTSVTPSDDVAVAGDDTAYRDGNLLVINKYYRPPVRCLFTGETPTKSQKSRKLQLTHVSPFFLFFLLLGLLPGIIIMMIFQKKLVVNSYNGETLLKKVKKRRIISAVLLHLAIGSFAIFSIIADPDYAMLALLAGSMTLIFALAIFASQPKRLTVKKYKKEYFFVKGVHESILALYPRVPDILTPPR